MTFYFPAYNSEVAKCLKQMQTLHYIKPTYSVSRLRLNVEITTFTAPTVPEYSTVYSTQTHIEKEQISLNFTWEVSCVIICLSVYNIL